MTMRQSLICCAAWLILLGVVSPGFVAAFQVEPLDQCGAPKKAESKAKRASSTVPDAEKPLRKTIEAQEQLVRDNPTVARYQSNLAKSFVDLGEIQHRANRLRTATESYKRAIELYEKLNRDDPTIVEYQNAIARGYAGLALALHSAGRLDEAIETYHKGIDAQVKIVETNPAVPEQQAMLGTLYLYAGIAERDNQALPLAEASHQKAVELFEELATDDPKLKSNLVGALAAYADTLAVALKWQAAADCYGRVVQLDERSRPMRTRRAVLQWVAGDTVGYRASCAELLTRYGKTENAVDALWIVQACVIGDNAVENMAGVIALAERTLAADPRNPVAKTLVGAAQLRAGQTADAVATLKASVPQHSLAALAAPKQLDHIRISRLLGESFLALAYQQLGNEQALGQQIKSIQDLLTRLEKPSPLQGEGLLPWSIPATLAITKRELARVQVTSQPQ